MANSVEPDQTAPDRMANSVAPDQTAPDRMANSVEPDLGLHCLIRHVCPKTWDHYGIVTHFVFSSLAHW